MRTHNICFCGAIRKISILLDYNKHLIKSYERVPIRYVFSNKSEENNIICLVKNDLSSAMTETYTT